MHVAVAGIKQSCDSSSIPEYRHIQGSFLCADDGALDFRTECPSIRFPKHSASDLKGSCNPYLEPHSDKWIRKIST